MPCNSNFHQNFELEMRKYFELELELSSIKPFELEWDLLWIR